MENNYLKSLRRIPVQDRSVELVHSVLQAAKDVLKTEGGAKATTIRIAKAAGVGIGSIYEYFNDKQNIFAPLLEKEAQENIEKLKVEFKELLAKGMPYFEEALDDFVERLFRYFWSIRKLTSNLFRALPYSTVESILKRSRMQAATMLSRELEKNGVRSETLKSDVFLYISVFMDLIHTMNYLESEYVDDLAHLNEVKSKLVAFAKLIVSKWEINPSSTGSEDKP